MMARGDARLQRLLGGRPLASLRKRLRLRYERQALDRSLDLFRISNLTVDEHAALAALMGRRARFSASMEVDVHAIDLALSQAGIATSLRDALELIDGPIVHRETARRELAAAWTNAVAAASHPSLTYFLRDPAGSGLLKRLSGSDPKAAAQLCRLADAVIGALPASGVARAQLAANTLGDAHALDNGRAVATLVLATWRYISMSAQDADTMYDVNEDDTDQPNPRDERTRDVWARAGVLVNELARPALLLNLPVSGTNLVSSLGEPSYVSLRILVRSPPSWTVAGQDVFVCENPNLLAIAADRLGLACAPIVCTEGMPGAAQRVLLTQLTKSGARLRYHGDFDWAGLRIGNHVLRTYGAVPWRFGTCDYVAAIESAPRPGQSLGDPAIAASWDSRLMAMMQTHQLAIAEESVADSLLADLAK